MSDFCGNYSFYVPTIPAGNYQLTIEISDSTNPQHIRTATSRWSSASRRSRTSAVAVRSRRGDPAVPSKFS